ncbi:MAG: GH1 family beta-glucosidase [Firmicutes bacterium]|nr:GH1 family beta-glucosidase [Bacillota bacterium]
MTTPPIFPPDFLWGAATSAYQVEGAPLADGAGPSNWHRFTHAPDSRIPGRHNGDVACDHYHRWPEDLALMKALGLNAYRFSLSWSRLLPAGKGQANAAGLAFYDRLVDALLEAGLRPFVTLYHWDLPAALEEEGGWLNAAALHWFAEYAHLACKTLGDRVEDWVTLNEPWVIAHEGHVTGHHAPGHRNFSEVPRVSLHLLQAHGAGVQACRAAGAKRVGLVVNLEPKYPASDRAEDVEAATHADAYMNLQFLEPIYRGHYPDILRSGLYGQWPDFSPEDRSLIQTPTDFLGINYYTRSLTAFDPPNQPLPWRSVPVPQSLRTTMGWEVYPQGLSETLIRVHDRYGPLPLLVTENGAAFPDPADPQWDGRDPQRVAYLRSHLRAVREAMGAGVDVRGYFAWSLLDNFEWALGYSQKFGLVRVDPVTLTRSPKASAWAFSEIARTRGSALDEGFEGSFNQ